MPIKPENKAKYPADWKAISRDIRFNRAQNQCENDVDGVRCTAINYQPHPITGSKVILTVAHLDHDPENNHYSNLKAKCQRCHLLYDKQHHKENAAKTRQRKKANSPQLTLQMGDQFEIGE